MLGTDFSSLSIINIVLTLFPLFMMGIIIWVIGLYFIDKYQTKSTLRRNFPIIARLRYLFEEMGTFFRQYLFALDREEMPFNRADRSWVYRVSKGVDSNIAFGSTRNLYIPGTIYFLNSVFPILKKETQETSEIIFGANGPNPYKTKSIFNISGMSYGALSIPAISALSKGAKLAGILINTGEGGLSPYHLEGGGDMIFQIGTAKFGVRKEDGGFDENRLKEIASYPQVKMFEIKLSQGAKPGKGGILPGAKVTEDIARIRGIKIGEDAISPNRHDEIDDIDGLLDMIEYIRKMTKKPVGIKVAVGDYKFFDDLCELIHIRGIKSAPDFINLDSADGGTGSAPMSLIDNVGLPIKEVLPIIIDKIIKHKLRDRIRIGASGKLITPTEVAWALCVGADYVNSARGFMFALGCIQSLQCNKNTCPTGITTHNKKLQYGLEPENKAVRVANYALNMEKEVAMLAHACGAKEIRLLSRKHARIALVNGKSASMDEIYPTAKTKVS